MSVELLERQNAKKSKKNLKINYYTLRYRRIYWLPDGRIDISIPAIYTIPHSLYVQTSYRLSLKSLSPLYIYKCVFAYLQRDCNVCCMFVFSFRVLPFSE